MVSVIQNIDAIKRAAMVCTFTSSQGPWLGSHELIRVVTVLRGTTSERMKALRAVSRYLTFTSTLAHHPSSYSSSRGSGRSRKMTKLATAPLSSALGTTRESHSLRHARYHNPQVTADGSPLQLVEGGMRVRKGRK